ncbi:MAG: heavy-metal-associated domain-containing protein [Methylococcaceae bacterium]|nr:heavy-metal-associated domain-containing protein [Methylococcaceae bacterium]
MNSFRSLFIVLILLLTTTTAFSEEAIYVLQVDGLACPFCTYGIEKNLSEIQNVKNIDVDLKNARILVTMHNDAQLSEQQVRQAVLDAGFTLRSFRKTGNNP